MKKVTSKSENIGLIGCGQMGEAFLKGIISYGIENNKILIYEKNIERVKYLKKKYKLDFCNSIKSLCETCELIFLCIKPQQLNDFSMNEGKNITPKNVVVSILAGVSIYLLEQCLNTKRIIRVMPNNPALIGEGLNAIVRSEMVEDEIYFSVIDILKRLGKVIEIDEKHFDALTSLSASSPAYIYILIEAMSDAGVYLGLTKEQSLFISSQTVLGAAKMVAEYGLHPAELKDKVASPGGTTIEGIKILDSKGFRGIIFEAICAAAEKSSKLLRK